MKNLINIVLIILFSCSNANGQNDTIPSHTDLKTRSDIIKTHSSEQWKSNEALNKQTQIYTNETIDKAKPKEKKINWWQALAGSLLPILIYSLNLARSIWLNFKNNSIIFGKWYAYHFTRINYKPTLKETEWEIKQRWRKPGVKIKVKDEKNGNTELNYAGGVNLDDNYISIDAKGEKHTETFQTKLMKPIPNSDSIMLGFNLGKDFNHELFATPILVCRNKRTKEDADKILKESNKWFRDELCIRLTKQPIESSKLK